MILADNINEKEYYEIAGNGRWVYDEAFVDNNNFIIRIVLISYNNNGYFLRIINNKLEEIINIK